MPQSARNSPGMEPAHAPAMSIEVHGAGSREAKPDGYLDALSEGGTRRNHRVVRAGAPTRDGGDDGATHWLVFSAVRGPDSGRSLRVCAERRGADTVLRTCHAHGPFALVALGHNASLAHCPGAMTLHAGWLTRSASTRRRSRYRPALFKMPDPIALVCFSSANSLSR